METLEKRLYAVQELTKRTDITHGTFLTDATIDEIRMTALDAQCEIMRLQAELRECRNELCLRCGSYRDAHLGACDGCKFKDIA